MIQHQKQSRLKLRENVITPERKVHMIVCMTVKQQEKTDGTRARNYNVA